METRMMVRIANGKEMACIAWNNNQCTVKFVELNKTVVLPVGTSVSVYLIERLYDGYNV